MKNDSVISASNSATKAQEKQNNLTSFYLSLSKIGTLHPTTDYTLCVLPTTNDYLEVDIGNNVHTKYGQNRSKLILKFDPYIESR